MEVERFLQITSFKFMTAYFRSLKITPTALISLVYNKV